MKSVMRVIVVRWAERTRDQSGRLGTSGLCDISMKDVVKVLSLGDLKDGCTNRTDQHTDLV